jgi:hypothetical protein
MLARSRRMDFSNQSLASWATILGMVISVLGLVQSRGWLTAIGVFFVGTSVVAVAYARRERLVVSSATVQLEGRSIDSLNVANLRRRVNRTLVIQDVHHIARVQGQDLKITWQYTGYCRADRETAIEFSVDSDNSIPFGALNCFAYDLARDPSKRHKIRPILIGPEGTSKKLAVPFLEPLVAQQRFAVLLKCKLPGCVKAGFGYYTSTLSFDQARVRRCITRLVFAGDRPLWVRTYDCLASGKTTLLKELFPVRQDRESSEYLDVAENVAGQSSRIYTFWRLAADASIHDSHEPT